MCLACLEHAEACFEHAEACVEHAAGKSEPWASILEPKVLHPRYCMLSFGRPASAKADQGWPESSKVMSVLLSNCEAFD